MRKYYFFTSSFVLLLSFLLIISCSKENQSEYVPVEDKLPIATDDIVNSTLENAVEISVANNDTTGDLIILNTISISGGIDTDNNGTLDKLVVENQGTWTVNTLSGSITFTPIATFINNPTSISYSAKDAQNNISNLANVVINVLSITIVNPEQEPFQKLSEYKFFVGLLKNQHPAFDVIPYEPASSLFTDYAKKKRFIWIPKGQKATYNSDDSVLELPVGSAIVKTFYYDNIQPNNNTVIIETRVMIRRQSGWIFAEYIWNNDQTEAKMDLSGSFKSLSWRDENNITKSVDYRIPSQAQCVLCHKKIESVTNTTYIPIGIKPQNLNNNYNYGYETKNQLTKWIESGHLENNFELPIASKTTVNYKDATKSLEVRARSYLDINCAHCHQEKRHCNYRDMKFAFSATGASNGQQNLGVCMNTFDVQGSNLSPFIKIVSPRNLGQSMMYYRLNTTEEAYRMPQHGRTIIHTEGVALIGQWINSLPACR